MVAFQVSGRVISYGGWGNLGDNGFVALASADKSGTVAPFVLAPIHALVTEASVTAEELQPYLGKGINVIAAK